MSTTITINHNQQMSGAISIILPMPTIILQFPIGHGQCNGLNFACGHCIQHNLIQTNNMNEEKNDIKIEVIEIKEEKNDIAAEVIEIKEEKIDIAAEVIEIKEEKIDIAAEVIEIKEENIDIAAEDEFNFDFEVDEYIFNKDPNLYLNMFSPISNTEFEDEESNQSYVSEDQEENIDALYKKCFDDIFEIMEYLKEDVI